MKNKKTALLMQRGVKLLELDIARRNCQKRARHKDVIHERSNACPIAGTTIQPNHGVIVLTFWLYVWINENGVMEAPVIGNAGFTAAAILADHVIYDKMSFVAIKRLFNVTKTYVAMACGYTV